MVRVSAGKLYFGVLGVAAALVLLLAFRTISPFSGLYAGITLGLVIGEAVVLSAFAVLLPMFHVRVESRVRMDAVLEAFGRKSAVRVKEVREDRAVRIARSIPLLNRLAERMERGIMGDVV